MTTIKKCDRINDRTNDAVRTAIFGAGQAGRMISAWLPADHQLICYIDNDETLQGSEIDGVPVLPLLCAMDRRPDVICIGTLNRQANTGIKNQILQAGFVGDIREALFYRGSQDARLAVIRLLAREIRERGVSGSIAELGVYRGDTAVELNRLFPERRLFLFDTFCGFDARDLEIERRIVPDGRKASARLCDFSDTSVETVEKRLPYPEKARLIAGYFPDSVSGGLSDEMGELALVSLDPDLGEPVYQGLRFFYPRLAAGGYIVLHDYNSLQFPGVRRAARRYCEENGLFVVPLMDLHGTAVFIKQG
ncbi:MAG: class I SAM-dependent methyltransferase [Clostridiales bacterium]|nr:class I SAM-dependent methyltransferase [Clostridiales bacterium]